MTSTTSPGTTLRRRTLLAGAASATAAQTLAACSRLSGSQASGGKGEQVVRWAQFYTTQSGSVAEANQKWLDRVIAAFEKENEGWTVDLEGYQWDQLDQRLILDLRADVPHDVSLTSPQLMAQHSEAGSLMDLKPRIDAWDEAQLSEFTWSPVWDSALIDGQQLGIPLGVATRGLALRPETLERAGLDPERGLTSPDQLVKLARKTTSGGNPGLLMYLGADRASTEVSVAPMVWHFGGDLLDSEARQATLTTEPVIEAVSWLRSLVRDDKVTPASAYSPTSTYDDIVLKAFVDGKAPAAFGFGNYWIQAMNDAKLVTDCYPASVDCAVAEADIAPVPTSAEEGFTNAWLASIGAQSEQPEMSWKLIEVMLRPEHLRTYPDAGLPARLSEYDRPEFSTPFYQNWQEIAKKGRGMAPTPFYPQLADTMSAAMQAVIGESASMSTSTIKTTLARFEDEWNGKHGGK